MATIAETLGYTETSLADDNLIAGDFDRVEMSCTIVSGQAALTRGTILGAVGVGAASSAAGGGNTGNGTMGSITVGALAQAGAYTLRITAAASNAGSFEVKDPQGDVVGLGTVGAAFSGGGLSFTLADGATDFAVNDTFTITVAAGSLKVKVCDATATDGSQHPVGILATDTVAAESGDVPAVMYVTGEFNRLGVTYIDSETSVPAAIETALALKNIYLKNVALI